MNRCSVALCVCFALACGPSKPAPAVVTSVSQASVAQIGVRSVEEAGDGLEFRLSLPVFEGLWTPEICKKLEDAIAADAMRAMASMKKARKEELALPEETRPPHPTTQSVVSSFEVRRNDARWISLTFDVMTDLGGAHPNTERHAHTIDVSTGRMVDLGELFRYDSGWEGKISAYVDAALKARADDLFPEALAVVHIVSPGRVWYLGERGITFVFQQYEIAPYASGFPEVEIPYAVVYGMEREGVTL